MPEWKNPITIEMEEYKELLKIAGRYEEIKGKEAKVNCVLHPKEYKDYNDIRVRDLSEERCTEAPRHALASEECCVAAVEDGEA